MSLESRHSGIRLNVRLLCRTFFRPEDVHRLEPKVVPTTGALVFDASSLDRIGVQCKLAKLAVPTQCTLKAGRAGCVRASTH